MLQRLILSITLFFTLTACSSSPEGATATRSVPTAVTSPTAPQAVTGLPASPQALVTQPPATLAMTAPVPTAEAAFDVLVIDSLLAGHQNVLDILAQVGGAADLRGEIADQITALETAYSEQTAQLQTWRDEWYSDLAGTGGLPSNAGVVPLSSDDTVPVELRYLNAMIGSLRASQPLAQICSTDAEREELRTLCATISAAQISTLEQLEAWRDEWFPASG